MAIEGRERGDRVIHRARAAQERARGSQAPPEVPPQVAAAAATEDEQPGPEEAPAHSDGGAGPGCEGSLLLWRRTYN